MNYAYYSNLALVTSVVVYALALLLHAAEWAAARKVGASAAGAADVSEPVLAGVTTADATSSQVRDHVASFDDRPAAPARAVVGARSGRGASAGAQSTGGAVDLERSDAVDLERSDAVDLERSDRFGRMGVSLTIIGWLLSVGGVSFRGLAAGRAPWGNMFEFTTAAMVFIVGAYLVMLWRLGIRWLGLPVTLLAAVGNGLAVTVFYVAVAPLVPALHSVWFLIHIVAAAIAGAAFNVGGLMSILYLIRKRAETRGAVRGYVARLPTARRIDTLAYRFLAFAFPLWTFTVAAGAIWAEYAWGRYWGWDPKETWALVTWVIFACYLHARSTAGWRGSRAAVVGIVGLASFWFNFIGINLFVSGLHSYAGV